MVRWVDRHRWTRSNGFGCNKVKVILFNEMRLHFIITITVFLRLTLQKCWHLFFSHLISSAFPISSARVSALRTTSLGKEPEIRDLLKLEEGFFDTFIRHWKLQSTVAPFSRMASSIYHELKMILEISQPHGQWLHRCFNGLVQLWDVTLHLWQGHWCHWPRHKGSGEKL